MYYTTKYGSFFTSFSYVFLIFNYWNVDIAMFVLRSPISPQMSKRIFGIINERGGVGVQISIRVGEGVGKTKIDRRGNVYLAPKSIISLFKDLIFNLKSNKQKPNYKPWQPNIQSISYSREPLLQRASYHVWVSAGSAYDKELRQQPDAFLKVKLFHLHYSKSFK